jgi:hypothetical protein
MQPAARFMLLWAEWAAATVVGAILAATIGAVCAWLGVGWWGLPIYGLGLAAPQWLLVRRYHAWAAWWFLATALGLALGSLLEGILNQQVLSLADRLGVPPNGRGGHLGAAGQMFDIWIPWVVTLPLSSLPLGVLQTLALTTTRGGAIAWVLVTAIAVPLFGYAVVGFVLRQSDQQGVLGFA